MASRLSGADARQHLLTVALIAHRERRRLVALRAGYCGVSLSLPISSHAGEWQMALKPCKECGREISSEASACPHCGKKDPTGKSTSPVAMGCLILILLGVFGSLVSRSGGNDSSSSTTASTSQAPPSPAPPPPAGSQWNYSHDADEMTGKASHVVSVESENTVQFDFPYQEAQHARLSIRRHPRFGKNVIFAIERGQL